MVTELCLASIIDAADGTGYGGVRSDAGFCIILLTHEDSDYTTAKPEVDRAAALAGLLNSGAGFIGVVDGNNSRRKSPNVAADNVALNEAGIPGAIFEIEDYVFDDETTNIQIIQTCINEIIAPVSYALDIKPTSCPNPVKFKGGGVLPVAIVGSDGADVTQIDPASIKLEGCHVRRFDYEDVTTTYTKGFSTPPSQRDCTRAGADGFLDLTLKFSKRCITKSMGVNGKREVRLLSLTGKTYSGDEFTLEDVVRLMR